MSQFCIEVTTTTPELIDGLWSHFGKITIKDFSEPFIMPIKNWTIQEYKKQWIHGLNRMYTHDSSCLVATVENLETKYPAITIWALYKTEEAIYFQNCLFIYETVRNKKKLRAFNATNCYDFIEPREIFTEDGTLISEWNISTQEFFASLHNVIFDEKCIS